MSRILTRMTLLILVTILAVVMAACGGATQQAAAPKAAAPTTAPTAAPTTAAAPKATDAPKAATTAAAPKVTSPTATVNPASKGSVLLDGSSTVFPISEAVAEEFQKANRNVRVTVGISGTGGGFKKFCNNEIDISNASRMIREAEAADCAKNAIEYVELPVAYDGLSVVVNPQNNWAECLTVAELKKIWEPDSKITNWKDVRAGFPDVPLKLYGPGTDSGTFDYFTEAINGKEKASRSDYQASEDDNVLVQGVSGDRGGMGYFGYAYFEENQSKLKLLGVDGGQGCIKPSPQTVESGQYKPLGRPVFIYPKKASLTAKPEVRDFVNYYLKEVSKLAPQVGYIRLPQKMYDDGQQKVDAVK